MDKIKSAKWNIFDLKSKEGILYLVACIAVVIQPLIDIISSSIINAGSEWAISFSGALRALMLVAILAFSWVVYNGRYKKLFSIYLSVSAGYIIFIGLMTALHGSFSAILYMIGLLTDTLFFQFMFVFLTEVFFMVRKRVHPFVMSLSAVIYALTLGINYIFKDKIDFKFSSAFACALAILIPFVLVYLSSKFGIAEKGNNAQNILSVFVPIIWIGLVIFGAVYSNSKAVLFSSVAFSVVFFVWAFSNWRNSSLKRRKDPLLRGWISAVLFGAIILSLIPISPVKEQFDGTFNIKNIFYTYQGVGTSDTDSSGNPVLPMFGDEDEEGEEENDYVPHLDSGYRPGQDKDEDEDKEESKKESSEAASDTTVTEPAGDESTSETETETEEQTTEDPVLTWPHSNGKPIVGPNGSLHQSDLDKFGGDIQALIDYIKGGNVTIPGIPPISRPNDTTKTPESNPESKPESKPETKPSTEPEKTEPATNPATDAAPQSEQAASVPVAAIGVGSLRAPLPIPQNFGAINIDRTKFYSDIMFDDSLQTVLFGLRFASLFDEDLTPAVKIHSDPITVMLNYGILGLIIYLLPLLFILYNVFKFIFTHLGIPSTSIGYVANMFAAFMIVFMSVLDGNILTSSPVSVVAALVLSNLFTMGEEASEKNAR